MPIFTFGKDHFPENKRPEKRPGPIKKTRKTNFFKTINLDGLRVYSGSNRHFLSNGMFESVKFDLGRAERPFQLVAPTG